MRSKKLIAFSLIAESLLESQEWSPDTEGEDEDWLTVVLVGGWVGRGWSPSSLFPAACIRQDT